MQYPDLFMYDENKNVIDYNWQAHWQRNEDALNSNPDIDSSMRLAGASEHNIHRARKNVRVVAALPAEDYDDKSTPANTSNVTTTITHITPNVAWKQVYGWMGSEAVARDELFILAVTAPEISTQVDAGESPQA